ncbi:hypothetical protein EG328_000957 [Venturia inaequalis]|uniref:Uncharacterized protein n=1 Tax=Venturia inaequalis TaxID=5025 RepID=A0A8H3Z9C8_VENIN|nr:hypothetical protein EG328_000957 [Venturia inaequalis]RDI82118.1 Sphingosine-1-phosphate lyase [Venturia inaequalis]
MRYSSAILALPALALAQDQVPLADKVRGWFKQAQEYLPTAASVPSVIPNPVDAGASFVAEAVVHELNLTNWQSIVAPSPSAQTAGPEEWMIFLTGGNTTCYGLCGNVTKEWTKSVALLEATASPPKFASIDCETEQILCNSWSVGPPSIVHVLLPAPLADQSKPATTVRFIPLNQVNTTASDIVELHTKSTYLDTEPYEGIWHPFDGLFATTGANVPIAYVMWGFAKMPSWLPMIAISMLSRRFMGRNVPQRAPAAGPAPAAAT